ncbi:MAG: ferredoxin FdxA [Myxococcota bacterium]|nr:ferredoxin FdxA [Myxococcota bacterium]
MPHVVTDPCVRCKFTDCVDVCPVDCFHEAEHLLVIDPEECIDCGACVPACPVEAIVLDEDVPADQLVYIQLNAQLSRTTPLIFSPKDPHPEVEKYRLVKGKYGLA